MKPTTLIARGAALAVFATMVLGATSAQAVNGGTQSGNFSSGCAVEWRTSAVMNMELTNDDLDYPGLMVDLNGNPVGYSNGGNIQEVNPLLGHAGMLEMNHFYLPGSSSFTQVWRIPTATDYEIKNAQVIFNLPVEVSAANLTAAFDPASANGNIGNWGANYAIYDWSQIATATDQGGGTWLVDLGDLPADSGTVYQFSVSLTSPAFSTSTSYVASATLTGNYLPGEAGDLCVQPEPDVAASDWRTLSKDCNAKTVTEARTVTRTDYFWDESISGWLPEEPTVANETQVRDMTSTEIAVCAQPSGGPNNLANTGGSAIMAPVFSVAILLGVSGLALVLRRRTAK